MSAGPDALSGVSHTSMRSLEIPELGHVVYERVDPPPTAGSSPAPVVLVHGLNSSRSVWLGQVEVLSTTRTVLLPDLRGHGDSSTPLDAPYAVPDYAGDVIALIEHLGYPQVDLLGTSLGGMVTQHVTTERPDLVRRLVLVDTMCGTPADMDLFGLADAIERDGVARVMREFVQTRTFAPPAPQQLIDAVMQTILAEPKELVAARWRQADYHGKDRARQIACPTLIIHGDRDRSVPLTSAIELLETVPNSQLAVFPNCGHMPFLEQPGRFSDEITHFLN